MPARVHFTSILGGLAAAIVALAVVASSCTGGGDAATTAAPTSSTTTPPPTTTRPAPSTTTTRPSFLIAVNVAEGPDSLQPALAEFYSWVGNRSLPTPDIPPGLVSHLEGVMPDADMTLEATAHTAEVEVGRAVAVVILGDDTVLMTSDDSGWRIHGAHLASMGADPWFGPPVRHVLVIGTDARPGQSQPGFRADSIHVLSSNLAERGGSVVGFPRDSYVPASYGNDKFTHINVNDGTEGMVTTAETVSGLDIEGYVLTGFLGFTRLVNDFGGVMVDVPFAMADPKSKAYLSAGLQRLWGDNALAFTRNRTIPGSDFTRSFHHGVVVLAALDGVLERDITTLPLLLGILSEHTWTDLSLADLLTLGATAFYLEPDAVENVVLEGSVGTAGGASVVFLDDESTAEVFADVADDGMLTIADEE